MTRRLLIAHGILWASAIVASAILHAPPVLTLLLLPVLATTALGMGRQRRETTACDV